MPISRSRKIARNIGRSVAEGNISASGTITGSSGGGVQTYSTSANLPNSADEGSLAYVLDTNKMYCYNNEVWVLAFTATTVNNSPNFVQGPRAGYVLSQDGDALVITLTAQDPEGATLTWSYSVTGGSLTNGGGTTATVSQSNNVFTITPTTNTDYGGSFYLTFSASDGANIANRRSRFTLKFSTTNWSYGLKQSDTIFPAYLSNNRSNKNFGKYFDAHNGTLASTGLVDSSTGNDHSVFVFDTTSSTASELYEFRDSIGSVDFPIAVHGDMIIAGTSDGCARILYRNNSNAWLCTQNLVGGTTTFDSNTDQINVALSSDGLILAVMRYVLVSATAQSVDDRSLKIYSRSSSTATTWTLRQTIDGSNWPQLNGYSMVDEQMADLGIALKVSPSGKHIVVGGTSTDSTGLAANAGAFFIFTNEDVGNTWAWTNTAASGIAEESFRGDDAYNLGFSFLNLATEDYLYMYNPAGVYDPTNRDTAVFESIKYDNITNTWTRKPYAVELGHFTSLSGDINVRGGRCLEAVLNPDEDSASGRELTLIFPFAEPVSEISSSCINTVRLRHKDLVDHVDTNDNHVQYAVDWTTQRNITGSEQYAYTYYPAITYKKMSDQGGEPQILLDRGANILYSSNHLDSANGNAAGIIKKYESGLTSTSDKGSPIAPKGTSFESVVVGYGFESPSETAASMTATDSDYTHIITVPEGVTEMTAVLIGAGGGSDYQASTSMSNPGSGGGGMVWFNNYPLTAGDTVSIWAGHTQHDGGAESRIYVNGNIIARAYDGGHIIRDRYTSGGGGGSGYLNPPSGASWVSGTDYKITSGGAGGSGSNSTSYTTGAGGGGAAGYGGNGASGRSSSSSSSAAAPASNSGAGYGGARGGYGQGVILTGYSTSSSSKGSDGYNNNSAISGQFPTSYAYSSEWGFGIDGKNRTQTRTNGLGGGQGAVRVIFGQNARFGSSFGNTSRAVRPISFYGPNTGTS